MRVEEMLPRARRGLEMGEGGGSDGKGEMEWRLKARWMREKCESSVVFVKGDKDRVSCLAVKFLPSRI